MPTTSRGPAGRSHPSGSRPVSRTRSRTATRGSTVRTGVDASPAGTARASRSTSPPASAPDAGPLPRPSLTTRAVVLLGVLAVLAASYAFPVRAWLDQRAAHAELVAERDALAAEVDDLQQARDQWDDPAYVRAQARERLNYVLPGEVGLVVLGTQSTPEKEPTGGAVLPALADDQPWWSTLVAAFREGGAPP